jgi:hypothetical protein
MSPQDPSIMRSGFPGVDATTRIMPAGTLHSGGGNHSALDAADRALGPSQKLQVLVDTNSSIQTALDPLRLILKLGVTTSSDNIAEGAGDGLLWISSGPVTDDSKDRLRSPRRSHPGSKCFPLRRLVRDRVLRGWERTRRGSCSPCQPTLRSISGAEKDVTERAPFGRPCRSHRRPRSP